MGEPNKILIQQSHLPPSVAVEECERVEGEYLIRFARAKDVGWGERFVRFFDDLITGTRKAKGFLCDRAALPAHAFIGGRSLVVRNGTAHPVGVEREKISISLISHPVVGASDGRTSKRSLSSLDAEIDLERKPKPDGGAESTAQPSAAVAATKANRTRMAGDLKGQFAANGLGREECGLAAFLECTRHSGTLDTTDVIKLMAFADQFARIEGELHVDVAAAVRDELGKLQSRIRQDLGSTGQASFHRFAFKVLNGPGEPSAPQPAAPTTSAPPSADAKLNAPPPVPSKEGRPPLSTNGMSIQPPPPHLPPPTQAPAEVATPPHGQSTRSDEGASTLSKSDQGSLAEAIAAGKKGLKAVQAKENKTQPAAGTSVPSAEMLAAAKAQLKSAPPPLPEKQEKKVSDPVAAALSAGLNKIQKGLKEDNTDASQDKSFWDDDQPASSSNGASPTQRPGST